MAVNTSKGGPGVDLNKLSKDIADALKKKPKPKPKKTDSDPGEDKDRDEKKDEEDSKKDREQRVLKYEDARQCVRSELLDKPFSEKTDRQRSKQIQETLMAWGGFGSSVDPEKQVERILLCMESKLLNNKKKRKRVTKYYSTRKP